MRVTAFLVGFMTKNWQISDQIHDHNRGGACVSSRSFSCRDLSQNSGECVFFGLQRPGLARAGSENASQQGCLDSLRRNFRLGSCSNIPCFWRLLSSVANDSGRSPALNGEPGIGFRIPVFSMTLRPLAQGPIEACCSLHKVCRASESDKAFRRETVSPHENNSGYSYAELKRRPEYS